MDSDALERGRLFDAMHREGWSWRDIAVTHDTTPNGARCAAQRFRKTQPLVDNVAVTHPSPQFSPETPEPPTMDELMSLARASQAVLDKSDPVIDHATISLNTDKPVGIIFVSCAHLGSRYAFYERFEQIFNQVLNTDRLYWLSLGDDIEGFLPGFPDGSAVVQQAIADPKNQKLMLAHVLTKLADKGKLLAGCASQHGGKWHESRTGLNPIKDMYLDRKVPFFDGKALLSLNVGQESYQLALAHEFPGNSIYNSNHAQRRAALFDFPSADLVVQGDKHKYAVTEMSLPPFEYDAGLRKSYLQWLVQVGTAKTGLDKYSIKGWSRGVLEWPIMIFRHDRHEITYARDLNLAKLMLDQW